MDISSPNRAQPSSSPTYSEKAQVHDNQPMKWSKDILWNFSICQSRKLRVVRLCLKRKSGGDFFSNPSHDMAKREQLLLVDK